MDAYAFKKAIDLGFTESASQEDILHLCIYFSDGAWDGEFGLGINKTVIVDTIGLHQLLWWSQILRRVRFHDIQGMQSTMIDLTLPTP